MDIVINVVEIYATGGVAYVIYNLLEVATLQRQSDVTRDKNLKNALVAQAKLHSDDLKRCWRWPYDVVKTCVTAVKWLRSL